MSCITQNINTIIGIMRSHDPDTSGSNFLFKVDLYFFAMFRFLRENPCAPITGVVHGKASSQCNGSLYFIRPRLATPMSIYSHPFVMNTWRAEELDHFPMHECEMRALLPRLWLCSASRHVHIWMYLCVCVSVCVRVCVCVCV